MEFYEIEEKNKILIDEAKNYMLDIPDYEHDINHMYDVVNYTKELLYILDVSANKEACIISAYWHDVGRIKGNKGHELLSANMLKEAMVSQKYDDNLIQLCYDAIIYHKWDMEPKTIEGLIVKDADKLAWLGKNRWDTCLEHEYPLDEILSLLSRLRNELLYFEESKEIYDRELINRFKTLYKKIYCEETRV